MVINGEKTAVTLLENYQETSFDVNTNAKVEEYVKTIVTIDGSAVTNKIALTGNDNNNSIIGGKGDDTFYGGAGNDSLKGGKGADTFVYSAGEGKDVITDYNADEGDIIKIASGTPKAINTVGKDVVFTFDKSNTLTVKNAKDLVNYVDASGVEHSYPEGIKLDPETETVFLTSKYYGKSFKLGEHDSLKAYYNIDASAVTGNIVINGDKKDNVIYGAAGDNTIEGGKGNDTLYGGDGANTYIYNNGDGNDVIVGYGEGDTLKIASGSLSGNSRVKNGRDVVFTVGKSNITLEGAAGKKITIDYDDEVFTTIKPISVDNTAESWFLADDDDFEVKIDNLSSLVKSNAADSYVAETTDALNFNKKDNSLPVVSYTSKK